MRNHLSAIPRCTLLLALASCAPTITVDDLTILSETEDYVEVQRGDQVGKLYKHFAHGFEEPEFLDWFGEQRWSSMSLLSPQTDSVPAYVELRKKIFSGESDFLDNRIDPEREQVFEGEGAARFYSVAPRPDMVTAKSMLQNDALWFVKGDDLWFKGRYYLEEGVPFTLVDFQERGRRQSPGPRITIWEQSHIGMELKHGGKPTMRQTVAPVPIGRWFELKVHMVLDDVEGDIQIWQDGELIIDGRVRTLPKANSLLNALEVGITATSEQTVLFADDIVIAHTEL